MNGLDLLKCAATAVKSREPRSVEDAEMLLGFFKTFVDRCHHVKEETGLFKEDNVLFSLAEGYLLGEDDLQIISRFADIERLVGEYSHERFHEMFRSFGSRYQLARP